VYLHLLISVRPSVDHAVTGGAQGYQVVQSISALMTSKDHVMYLEVLRRTAELATPRIPAEYFLT
jgi:hypothetical protein